MITRRNVRLSCNSLLSNGSDSEYGNGVVEQTGVFDLAQMLTTRLPDGF